MNDPDTAKPAVIFDTTVVSAAAFHPGGASMKAVRWMERGKVTAIVSNRLRAEYERTLNQPALRERFPFLTEEYIAAQLDRFDVHAERVPNPPTHLPYPRDPDDEHIVNLVIESRADFLVTLDADLLALGDYPPYQKQAITTQILRPGAFLTEMERHEQEASSEPI